jgi:AcrR family transcriptional regulator
MTNNQNIPDTSTRILLAAAEEFISNGYDNTKLDEIVRKAQVSKTAIYKYYGGKRELFIAIAEHLTEDMLRLTKNPKDFKITSIDDLKNILKRVGQDYLTCALNKENILTFRMSLTMANRIEEVSKLFYYMGHLQLCQFIARYFQAASDANLLKINDAERAAGHYLALLRGDTHLRAVFDPDYKMTEQEMEESIDDSIEIFLNGTAKS